MHKHLNASECVPMTCHKCAKPNCVDDCENFPPPALKVGSAEHKLQVLLIIANQMASEPFRWDMDSWKRNCIFCDAENVDPSIDYSQHKPDCLFLKLEQFKATLN